MKSIFFSVLIAAVLFGCSQTKTTESIPGKKFSTTSVVVTHRVSDFDKWLANYSAGDSVRVAGGLINDRVYRSVEDSSVVTVAAYTTSHDDAISFLNDENLQESMQEAGVISDLEVSFWDVKWRNEGDDFPEFLGYLLISHGVESYDKWESVYMNYDSLRESYGIFTLTISTELDSAKNVGVLLGVAEFDGVNAMMENVDIGEQMVKAGVLGDPKVQVLSAVSDSQSL